MPDERELQTVMHNQNAQRQIGLTNLTLSHAWGMLACVGYSTDHWIGASVALAIALWMKPSG